MIDGGQCSIFEIMFKLKKAVIRSKQHNDHIEDLLRSLKPDFMLEKGEFNQKNLLEYSCLKIVNKIMGTGKDVKQIFEAWDIDKNGWLDA